MKQFLSVVSSSCSFSCAQGACVFRDHQFSGGYGQSDEEYRHYHRGAQPGCHPTESGDSGAGRGPFVGRSLVGSQCPDQQRAVASGRCA